MILISILIHQCRTVDAMNVKHFNNMNTINKIKLYRVIVLVIRFLLNNYK